MYKPTAAGGDVCHTRLLVLLLYHSYSPEANTKCGLLWSRCCLGGLLHSRLGRWRGRRGRNLLRHLCVVCDPTHSHTDMESSYCALCRAFDQAVDLAGFWQAKPPSTFEEQQKRQIVLQCNVHESCIKQAKQDGLLCDIPSVDFSPNLNFTSPLVAIPTTNLLFAKPLVSNSNRHMEVPLQAQQGFATGFRLYPQVHPPRTLEDLLHCTSGASSNTRLCESSLMLDVKSLFPELFKTLVDVLPEQLRPKSPYDALWQQAGGGFKLRVASQGCSQLFKISQFRTAMVANAQVEWAGLSPSDAAKVLHLSDRFRSRLDNKWIPDLAFCLRNRLVVHHSSIVPANNIVIALPGSGSWCFYREVGPTLGVEWRFAERTLEAFKYALQANNPVERYPFDIEALKFFHSLVNKESALLSQSLRLALVERLQAVVGTEPPVEKITSVSCSKSLCDLCQKELFHRLVFCAECDRVGEEPALVLEALYPLSRQKKDRSVLPDCFRSGCRVLVNLTVSGNSNDRPPRQIGASYLPGILLKTGHGFFTVYLEGGRETVVKRRAALDRHPSGTGLPNGYVVMMNNTNPDDMPPGTTCTISKMTPAYRPNVYCHECFKVHRHATSSSAVVVDQRYVVLKKDLDRWAADHQPNEGGEGEWRATNNTNSEGELPVDDETAPSPFSPLAATAVSSSSPLAGGGEALAKFLPSVSDQAAMNAMSFAQLMGPSPYSNALTVNGASPPSSPSSFMPIKMAKPPSHNNGGGGNAGGANIKRARADSALLGLSLLPMDSTSISAANASGIPTAAASRKKSRAASVHLTSSSFIHDFPIVSPHPPLSRATFADQPSPQPPVVAIDLPSLLSTTSFLMRPSPCPVDCTLPYAFDQPAVVETTEKEIQKLRERAKFEVPLRRNWSFLL
ncbi:hypothetical protein BASA81_008730 [Batrachochytrium salamandrivorans]|nr:hypothetical protein BASA81_008730 [Batrachochytrium salamandrivorans]